MAHFGYADEAQYAALLHRADVVVSTALHEFFGVAVVEAIYCGCFPMLPRRPLRYNRHWTLPQVYNSLREGIELEPRDCCLLVGLNGGEDCPAGRPEPGTNG